MTLPDFLSREPDGFVHLTGHRIGLHHLIRSYNEGFSPEMILGEYPTLSLALIHKVIACYLENQPEIDAYITAEERATEVQRAAASHGSSLQELRERMRKLRAS
jgi:uncharacterized protein (DUF433 family)